MKKTPRRSRTSLKAVDIRTVVVLVVLALVAFGSGTISAQPNHNVLTSSTSSVLLKHWTIAPDLFPHDSLTILPDSAWQAFESSPDIEAFAFGNWLLRTDVIITDSVGRGTPIGLFPKRLATAYEISWDGIRIGRNGALGTDSNEETPGSIPFNLLLPSNVTAPGKHTIIVRISDHQRLSSWRWYYGGLFIGPYDAELNGAVRSSSWMFLSIGVLAVPFLFNLFLYFARSRKVEHLLFSIICSLVIADSMTAQLPTLVRIPTTFVHSELIIYQAITVLLSLLFPAFLISLFSLPRRSFAVVAAVNVVVLFFRHDFWDMFDIMALVVLILSSGLTAWAAWKRREGSMVILAGLLPAWICYAFGLGFTGLAAVMVICTSVTTAQQIARRERTEREALLRSSRLENELLRKNINPHFLLNTLTSIIVWLRKDPKSAIKLIEALAEEFRVIGQISDLQRIPMQQEIDLCNAHLRIMSYRKGAEYTLETSGIDENEEIPPMIFHTLIENGLSHGYENKTRGVFTLHRTRHPKSVEYRLHNDGEFTGSEKKDSSGFGLKYVKGRLEESYPNRWKMISQECAHGWETIIEIREE